MRKKILFLLADSLIKPCGGLGERFRHLLPIINKEHDCSVFCIGAGGTFLNIPVRGLDEISVPFNSGQALQALMSAYINEFIDETFVPDVIVATDHMMIYPAFNVARYRKCKLVVEFDLALFSFQKQYDQQQLEPYFKIYSDYINEAEQFGIAAASRVVLCSNYYKDELPIQPRHEAVVVPNGINVDAWTKPSAPFKFPGNYKHNLVYLGRINSQKGVELLFDLDLPPDTALHFVGPAQGSNKFDAMKKAVEAKENFFYLGTKFDNEKISVMKSADAILFPTLHEPFGIVFLEALISKTILITTMTGEMKTALTENDCIKCEANTASIKACIDRLISMTADEKTQMIESGFSIANKYTWENAANKFIQLLNEL